MGHFKSFFSAAMLCTIWLILLQTLGKFTSSKAASVRLVHGTSRCFGIVQVFRFGIWGTVCYEGWDLLDANVVCRALDCRGTKEVNAVGYYGPISGQIWMSNVKCSGNESSLAECLADNWEQDSCQPDLYAGVICPPPVRLVDGDNICSGRVEVLLDGQWGTVCDDGWDLSDAAVVCRELGCGDAVAAKSAAYFGPGTGPVLMNFVHCVGNEPTLMQCDFEHVSQSSLWHEEDAGVICSEFTSADGGPVEGSHSGVKVLLRIEVKTDPKINLNDPETMSKLSEETRKKLQISGPLSLTWKTQPDGKVFQNVYQKKKAPKTCN